MNAFRGKIKGPSESFHAYIRATLLFEIVHLMSYVMYAWK